LGLDSADVWVLPSDLTAAHLARLRIEHACAGMPQEKVDVARLLVTELVTNAVQHGAGTVVLHVARDGVRVRVHVEDESPDLPVVVEPKQPWPDRGAGMRLVAALADSWGVAPRGDGQPGKRVWFALD
jgi:anti-sigma regulatory factor (Ser/Thr protein kinase)